MNTPHITGGVHPRRAHNGSRRILAGNAFGLPLAIQRLLLGASFLTCFVLAACGSSEPTNPSGGNVANVEQVDASKFLLPLESVPVGFEQTDQQLINANPKTGSLGGATQTLEVTNGGWTIGQLVFVYDSANDAATGYRETLSTFDSGKQTAEAAGIYTQTYSPAPLGDQTFGEFGNDINGGSMCAIVWQHGTVVDWIHVNAPAGMLQAAACDKIAAAADGLI